MDNLIIFFEGSVGEASIYIVDDDSYDALYNIYDSQKPDGYDEMTKEFHQKFNELYEQKKFRHFYPQYNSHDHFDEPVTFKRSISII